MGAVEAQRLGGHVPVDGEGRAGQGRGAQRALVHPRPRVGEARGVAAEHLHIGHQVVAEGHRLGRLQVGEARHQGRGVRLGLGDQGSLQSLELVWTSGRRPRGPTCGSRAPPGRCASGRCAAARPPARSARAAAPPRSCGCLRIPRGTGRSRRPSPRRWSSRPPRIAAASSLVMTPVFCNIAACARDPSRSCAASRRSKPMETLIACISSAGLSEKRPPHIACPPAGGGVRGVRGRVSVI